MVLDKSKKIRLLYGLALFSIVVIVCFSLWNDYARLNQRAEQAISNIEREIDAVTKVIKSLPSDAACDKQVVGSLSRRVYNEINIRALGIHEADSNVTCTNHGLLEIKLDDDYWQLADDQTPFFFAVNTGYRYADESSLLVAEKQGEVVRVAAVDPKIIERLWIDDDFNADSYYLNLHGIDEPLFMLSRGQEHQGQIEVLFSFSSERYPLTIHVVMLWKSLIVKLAKIFAVALFISFSFMGFFYHLQAMFSSKHELDVDYAH